MFTVRISQSDPRLFSGIDHALADPRITGQDVYFHVEPGTYVFPEHVTVGRHIMVVPTHGPGTVFLQSPGGRIFDVAAGRLELHGVTLRGPDPESQTVVVRDGAALTARDSTLASGAIGMASGSHADIENCGFQDAHLLMVGVQARVRRCSFERSDLWLCDGGEAALDGLRFAGPGIQGPALVVIDASPRIGDCRVEAAGSEKKSAVLVHSKGTAETAPRITGLEVVDSVTSALSCTRGSAAEFTRLLVRGGGAPEGSAAYLLGSVRIREGEFRDIRGLSGILVNGGVLRASGLVLDRAGQNSLFVYGKGEAEIDGVRCTGFGQWGIRLQEGADVRLSDAELSDVPELSRDEGRPERAGAVAVVGAALEARGVVVGGVPGPALLVGEGEARVSGLDVSGESAGVRAAGSGHAIVDGVRFGADVRSPERGGDGTPGPLLLGVEGGRITADRVEARGAQACGVRVEGGAVVLRSSRFERLAGHGVHALGGGTVEAEDTVFADGASSGVVIAEPESDVVLHRCTVTGHAGPGLVEHPDTAISVKDCEVADNGEPEQGPGDAADPDAPPPEPQAPAVGPEPVHVRLSQTDPDAYTNLRALLEDTGLGGGDLLVAVDPGTYPVHEPIAVQRTVELTAAEGPGTVTFATGQSVVFDVAGAGRLGMRGITVRNRGREHAPVRVGVGTHWWARDSVFVSNTRVVVDRADADLEDCLFRGGGLRLASASGAVRGCSFEYASAFVLGGDGPDLEGLRFEGADHLGGPSIRISAASPRVTDCTVTGGGDDDGTAAVVVVGRAAPVFTGLSVVDSRAQAILCREGSRAEFSALSVRGGDGLANGVVALVEADTVIRDGEILGAEGVCGLWAKGGTLLLNGLTVERAGDTGVIAEDGAQVHSEGLRCRDYRLNGVLLHAAEADLTDTLLVRGQGPTRDGQRGRGSVIALNSALTARSLTVEGSPDHAVEAEDSRVSVHGLAVSGATRGVYAHQGAHVDLVGAAFRRITLPVEETPQALPFLLRAEKNSEIAAENVLAEGVEGTGCQAAGGHIRVRSSRFRGLTGTGFLVGTGGSVAAEDTVLQDGGGHAVVAEHGAEAVLRRCTLTGHQGRAFEEDPEASVTVEDCTIADNELDPDLGTVTLHVSRSDPDAWPGPREALMAPEAEGHGVSLVVAPGTYAIGGTPLPSDGPVRVVAAEGPGTVVFESDEDNVFNARGHLVDLRGITVRSTCTEYPPLYAAPGSRVTARNCTVESAVPVCAEGALVEIDDCRFDAGGLALGESRGYVRGCTFSAAMLAAVGESTGGDLELHGLRFDGAAAGFANLEIDGASPRVSDCRVVGGGHQQGTAAVRVVGERGHAAPVFTDLSVLGSDGPALWCRGNTRSEFTRLHVEGGRGSHGGEVGFVGSADAVIRDSTVVDTRGSDGILVEGGTVEAAGLTLRGAGDRGMSVREGATVTLERLRCLAYAGWAVVCLDSTLDLADSELIDVPEVSRAAQWGIADGVGALEAVRSTLRVRGLAVEGSPGTAVSLVDTHATLIGATVSGGPAGIRAGEGARATLREVRVTGLAAAVADTEQGDRAGLSVTGGAEVWAERFEAVNLPEHGVHVRGGSFVATAGLLEGNAGAGADVGRGSTVDLIDTVVTGNGGAGIDVAPNAFLAVRGGTVEGNTGGRIVEHPGSTVVVEAVDLPGEDADAPAEPTGHGSEAPGSEQPEPDEPAATAEPATPEEPEPLPREPRELRVSWADRSAHPGIREALAHAGGDGHPVRLLVDPGVYTVSQEIDGDVAVVPTQGPGTVALEGGGGNVFAVRHGHLELHGVTVHNTADDCPPVLLQEGTRFTARGCTFLSPSRVFVEEADVAVEDCVFRGGGLRLDGSNGHVRGCRVEEGALRVSGRGHVEVEGLRVDSSGPVPGPGPLLWIEDAAPHVRDCRITGRGAQDRIAVMVTGSRRGTAPVLSDLWIVDTGGRGGLTVRGARLYASGLTLHGTGERGLVLEDGAEAEVSGLRCGDATGGVLVEDGALVLRSGSLCGNAGEGLSVPDGGTVEMTDTAVCGNGLAGIALGDGARLSMRGCTVTGNGGVAVAELPGAVVKAEDCELADGPSEGPEPGGVLVAP
ncbi:hypothetical protein IDM40_03945 [Nocardiopsis sp. HNM0947]|uniref:Right handed beta helix domain-containing protein n=1 Tax=Nocardiopsis coralli TaxID=2772213 RepID=A0ABR9P1Z6_9ACTN|nr:right-handed parallel beta-helix repeat-containing protein [Nocardiopsis coralli]MBE2997866.1 hypothetical protein [Nocardiopsis coralli]